MSPLFFPEITDDLFLLITVIFIGFHSGVTPLEGVTPHLFLPVRPRLFTIFFVNLLTKNYSPSDVTPWRVLPGAVRPRFPPSDATD